MRLQVVLQVGLVLAAALLQDRIPGDDPALDLAEPDLAAELDRLARLEPGDDLGVRLEQREQLLLRRYRLALQHPTSRLLDALSEPGQEPAESRGQVLRPLL